MSSISLFLLLQFGQLSVGPLISIFFVISAPLKFRVHFSPSLVFARTSHLTSPHSAPGSSASLSWRITYQPYSDFRTVSHSSSARKDIGTIGGCHARILLTSALEVDAPP